MSPPSFLLITFLSVVGSGIGIAMFASLPAPKGVLGCDDTEQEASMVASPPHQYPSEWGGELLPFGDLRSNMCYEVYKAGESFVAFTEFANAFMYQPFKWNPAKYEPHVRCHNAKERDGIPQRQQTQCTSVTRSSTPVMERYTMTKIGWFKSADSEPLCCGHPTRKRREGDRFHSYSLHKETSGHDEHLDLFVCCPCEMMIPGPDGLPLLDRA